MSKAIKTLFLGSNWEALDTLKALDDDKRFKIAGVITKPDKPVGRKQKILPTEIKIYAQQNSIPVFHTHGKSKLYRLALEKFQPELIVCKSFGEILPSFFIDFPKFGSINVHYSLLPKYRGAIPIQKAILEGDSRTGITIVKMVRKLDAGPILAQFEEKIKPDDTNLSLRKRLVTKTREVLADTLIRWIDGDLKTMPQDDSKATYCTQDEISKENAYINFRNMAPELIYRKVRALIPWPVAWCYFPGRDTNSTEKNLTRMKIFDIKLVSLSNLDFSLNPGQFGIHANHFYVGSIDPRILIEFISVQLAGRSKIPVEELVNGLKNLL